MKVILKNSNLVFQKGMFKKTIVLKGLMTESVKMFTDMEPLELDPTKYYRITIPKTAWSIENYTSYYIVALQDRTQKFAIRTDNAKSLDGFLSLHNETIVTGISLLEGGVRADKNVEVPITIEEVEVKKEIIFNEDYNITQGVGVYDLYFPFENGEMYEFSFDDSKIKLVGNKVVYSSGVYQYLNVGNDSARKYISNIASYEKSQFGAGDVLATGTVNIKIYKVTV